MTRALQVSNLLGRPLLWPVQLLWQARLCSLRNLMWPHAVAHFQYVVVRVIVIVFVRVLARKCARLTVYVCMPKKPAAPF